MSERTSHLDVTKHEAPEPMPSSPFTGLGHVRDERLTRSFEHKEVTVARPVGNPDEWFNLMAIHQNRHPRGGAARAHTLRYGGAMVELWWSCGGDMVEIWWRYGVWVRLWMGSGAWGVGSGQWAVGSG